MKNKLYILGILVGLVCVLVLIVFLSKGKKSEAPVLTGTATTTTANPSTKVEYKNTDYGFTFDLPDTWKGYTIIEDEWEGNSLVVSTQGIVTEHGPLISIRHPDWEYKSPRQDIPVMVFTLKQWNDLQTEKFHIGAAPINPSELGRNTKYVFALPARYNFAYQTGYEEVEQILQGKPLHTF